MITIESIGFRHGYTGCDHLLDDGPLTDMIGRSFRSVGEARRAAESLTSRTQDRRVRLAPVSMTVRLASGATGGRMKTMKQPRVPLAWREGGYDNERAVRCCGCGATIAVCESRVAVTVEDVALFSCSPECEQEVDP